MPATNAVTWNAHSTETMEFGIADTVETDSTAVSSVIAPDRLAQKEADEPTAVMEFRECVENAFARYTGPSGSLVLWEQRWELEPAANVLLLVSPESSAFGSPSEPTVVARISSLQPHLEAIQWIRAASGISLERLSRLLGVSRQTINLWERGKPIAYENRRRLLGLRDVLERASLRYHRPADLQAWLDTPRGPEGLSPAEILERGEIGRARTLAMSMPSAGLVRAPSWVRRPVPDAFRTRSEGENRAMPPDRDEDFVAFAHEESDLGEDVDTIVEGEG